MIKFERDEGNLDGKRRLYSLIPWLEDEKAFQLYNEEREVINIFKYEKLKNQSLKITVGKNQYIKIAEVRVPNEKHNIIYTGMEDSNTSYKNGDISIYLDRPTELWIDFNNRDINFIKYNSVFRAYYIYVMNDNDLALEKYLIYVKLTHKNNGTIANPDFKIDVEVSCRKIGHINVAYGIIDFAFFGYIIWIIANVICLNNYNNFINNLISNNTIYIISLSYLSQIWFRYKYVGNSYANRFKYYILKYWHKIFRKKEIHKDFLTNHEVVKRIQNYYKRSLKVKTEK